jgi:hypothetical protein
VSAFHQALPDPTVKDAIDVEDDVLSLVSAAVMWAGWPVVRADLRASCLVIAATASPEGA